MDGHLRRLPGPGEGGLRRRGVPRRGPPVRGELDQLGPGDGPDRLLRDAPTWRSPRTAGRSASCVPTGNFGNILAGWVAKRMGLPVDRLVVASNRNDILTRFFTTGTMEIREVVPTTSPVDGHPGQLQPGAAAVRGAGSRRCRRGRPDGPVPRPTAPSSVPVEVLEVLRDEFDCGRLDDESAAEVIRRDPRAARACSLDPHTAVGVGVAPSPPPVTRRCPVVSAGDRPPGQVPRRGARRRGVRPPLPAQPGRPVRATRTHRARAAPSWPRCRRCVRGVLVRQLSDRRRLAHSPSPRGGLQSDGSTGAGRDCAGRFRVAASTTGVRHLADADPTVGAPSHERPTA